MNNVMANDDDAFKKAASALSTENKDSPDVVKWPESLKFLPCSKWTRNTWHGLSAIFSGACI